MAPVVVDAAMVAWVICSSICCVLAVDEIAFRSQIFFSFAQTQFLCHCRRHRRRRRRRSRFRRRHCHWCWFEWNGLVVAISWHRSRHLAFFPYFILMIIIFWIYVEYHTYWAHELSKMKYNSDIFLLSFLRSQFFSSSSSSTTFFFIAIVVMFHVLTEQLSIGTTHIDELNVRARRRAQRLKRRKKKKTQMNVSILGVNFYKSQILSISLYPDLNPHTVLAAQLISYFRFDDYCFSINVAGSMLSHSQPKSDETNVSTSEKQKQRQLRQQQQKRLISYAQLMVGKKRHRTKQKRI